MSRILAIDDDACALDYLRGLLECDHEVVTCAGGAEGLARLAVESFDLVLTDLGMPDPDGFEILRYAGEQPGAPPVIVLTAADRASATMTALRLGALDYIVKPATPTDIRAAVARGTRRHPADDPSHETYGLTGNSEPMRQLRRILPLFARADESVLLIGETGVGKELVAHALHDFGSRASGPFIAHNLAATPVDLSESLFFGHVRGSFSGAHADHAGLFEQAHGGTLFLDELDSFPLGLQAKLLRVLETRHVQRIGGYGERGFDARVIAATSIDPAELVAAGRFRADLHFRLRQLEIVVPPLRHRIEDLPELIQHFLEEWGGAPGGASRLSSQAMERLYAYPWPGNVRELRHVLRTAALLAEGGSILPKHLPASLSKPRVTIPLRETPLDRVEHDHIVRTLELAGGNQKRAAQMLGIDRGTLARRLRRQEPNPPLRRA